jgi:hypothetical protein
MTLLLSLFLILFQDFTEVELPSKPEKANAVEMEELFTIIPEEGFYTSITSKFSDDGSFAIFDQGNFEVHYYNKDGEELSVFGKEGNGPGEFTKFDRVGLVNKNYIVMLRWNRIQVFNHKGKLVGECNGNGYGKLTVTENRIHIEYDGSRWQEHKSKTYDFSGKELSAKKNKEYKARDPNNNWTPDDGLKEQKENYTKPFAKMSFRDGYLQRYKGEYKFEYVNEKTNKGTRFTRDYKRVKQTEYQKYLISSNKKTEEEFHAKYVAMMQAVSGGYYDDIQGYYSIDDFPYLFVRTRAPKKSSLLVDLFNEDFDFYTQIKLEEESEIQQAYFTENKIVLHLKNDEDGPFLKAYSYKIK